MSGRAFAYWQEMQAHGQQDAPDIRVLWQRRPRARKPYLCDACGEPIVIGEEYESAGIIEDGQFRHERRHVAAYHYPSGCPSQRARDIAEAEEQFRKDEAMFGGASS